MANTTRMATQKRYRRFFALLMEPYLQDRLCSERLIEVSIHGRASDDQWRRWAEGGICRL
jgi:hypothetical protein